MTDAIVDRTNAIGIASAVGASVAFSINDVTIKFLSGDFPLHEVVLIRSAIGLLVLVGIIVPLEGGFHVLRTRRLGIHVIRGGCVVFANMSFFLALASMKLAETVAIFFVSPMIITAFSVVFLGERVGARRWAAVGIGMLGVLIVMRPGSSAFQLASLLPLAAAVGYAFLHILTRKIGVTEKAVTMTFYILIVFIVSSGLIGLFVGDGRYAGQTNPSLEFLFRPWVWPDAKDWPVLIMLGVAATTGGYLISQAYRLCEAGLAAPFEYVALPLSILWGYTIFSELPDPMTWAGVGLILSGGLYMFWREAVQGRKIAGLSPPKRR